jgi:hypothetical protein
MAAPSRDVGSSCVRPHNPVDQTQGAGHVGLCRQIRASRRIPGTSSPASRFKARHPGFSSIKRASSLPSQLGRTARGWCLSRSRTSRARPLVSSRSTSIGQPAHQAKSDVARAGGRHGGDRVACAPTPRAALRGFGGFQRSPYSALPADRLAVANRGRQNSTGQRITVAVPTDRDACRLCQAVSYGRSVRKTRSHARGEDPAQALEPSRARQRSGPRPGACPAPSFCVGARCAIAASIVILFPPREHIVERGPAPTSTLCLKKPVW